MVIDDVPSSVMDVEERHDPRRGCCSTGLVLRLAVSVRRPSLMLTGRLASLSRGCMVVPTPLLSLS